jgi:hypothetical protein
MFLGGTMAEGWACYATDLMDECGFLTPEESVSQQHTRARLLARAVVDIGLHERSLTSRRGVASIATGSACRRGRRAAKRARTRCFRHGASCTGSAPTACTGCARLASARGRRVLAAALSRSPAVVRIDPGAAHRADLV